MYYVLLKGEGEGCNYIIGCNMKWLPLKAQAIDDAMVEASKIVEDHGEDRIAQAIVVGVDEQLDFDMDEFRRIRRAQALRADAEREKRRAEFEPQPSIKVVKAGVGDPHPEFTHCPRCGRTFGPGVDQVETCTELSYVTLCLDCYAKAGNSVR
ncbi:MAG: hypothetical protein E6Q97_14435 [Desulfurellales bacterium]|nr:MAG: hypothetical protein E6Q97_14435 [Desulfurellales bacterium]